MLAFLQQLPPFVMDVIRTAIWLLLITLVFVPLEQLFAVHPRKLLTRGTLSDVGFYFISALLPGVILSAMLAPVAVLAHRYVPWPVQQEVASWPLWARALGALVVGEIGFYWGHRWSHQIPFLWQFHAVHHKPEEIYYLISSRAHPFDNVFIRLCGFVPITVLGLSTPLTAQGGYISLILLLVLTLWGFLIHANLRWRLGPLEWLVAKPAFHHWHHTFEQPRDRNYASTLPVMDLVFGTFFLPKRWPERYGTDTEMPRSVVGQLAHPFIGSPRQIRPAPTAPETLG